MASASPLSSSSSARPWKYDVFLSFRGRDTLKGITSELHRRLTKRGIETFMDDPNNQVGHVVSPTLLEAIEESRFAIIILSPNYASSTRCLQELTKICQCMEYNNRNILPLFFNVRFQKRSFQQVFTDYENSGLYRSKKLQEWKDALTKVANFSGWDLKNYNTERELVKEIVEYMYSLVKPNENNWGDLEEFEAITEAINNAVHVESSWNDNLGKQGDVVKSVRSDFIRVSYIINGNISHEGPRGDVIRGDRGGDGGYCYHGGFAGAGGPAKGKNTFNYGKK